MLCLLKKKLHTLCLCLQYRIKPIFPYFVDNFLALVYTIYVAVTYYVLYCMIFGENTFTVAKRSPVFLLVYLTLFNHKINQLTLKLLYVL